MGKHKPNNIKFFNRLTHDDDGNPIVDVSNKLLIDNKSYELIKKLFNKEKIKLKHAKLKRGYLRFYIEFKDENKLNNYVEKYENEKFSYKNKKYKPVFKKVEEGTGQQIIEVFFK